MDRNPKKRAITFYWQLESGPSGYFSIPLPGLLWMMGAAIGFLIFLSLYLLFESPLAFSGGDHGTSSRSIARKNQSLIGTLYSRQEMIYSLLSGGAEFSCEATENPALDCGISALGANSDYASFYDSEMQYIPHLLPLNTSTPVVTSGYGIRPAVNGVGIQFHQALDLRALRKEEVLAAAAGYVEEVRRSNYGYGNYVRILHAHGYETRYAHLDSIAIKQGSNVLPGDLIGRAGNTGKTTGPHLHFEIRLNGKPVNPEGFLSFR